MTMASLQALVSLAAQTTQVDSVPALPAAAADGGLDYLELMLHASLPVQLVLVVLILASLVSWGVIFHKRKILNETRRGTDEFEERFWSGGDLATLYSEISSSQEQPTGLSAVFEAGFREFARLRQKRGITGQIQVEGAQRAMRASMVREVDRLENNLELLANVGSISPYIGLFGTVWGIMVSFHGLAAMQEATIATVAPGISEALVATAAGLFAAIPAVWAYNRFVTLVDRISVRYEAFADEFSSILQRQSTQGGA